MRRGRSAWRLAGGMGGAAVLLALLASGYQDPAAGAPGDDHRPEDHDDYPEGSYEEWAERCDTGLPLKDVGGDVDPDPPLRLENVVDNYLFRTEYPPDTDPGDLTTYCGYPDDSSITGFTYWRIDDYPHGEPFEPFEPMPEPDENGCVSLVRTRWTIPDTISDEHDVGEVGYPGTDPKYGVRYCREGAAWLLVDDPLAAQDHICIQLRYDEEEKGEPPPDEVALDDIDDVGELYPPNANQSLTGDEEYCRNGGLWERGARDTDHPGHDNWDEWAEECITILPTGGTTPLEHVGDLELLGRIIDEEDHGRARPGAETLSVEELATYCRAGSDEQWYRVDDESVLSSTLGEDWDNRGNPEHGDCWVIDPLLGWGPEQLSATQHPSDFGSMTEQESWEQTGVEYDDRQLYCWMFGAWYRGDVLGSLDCETIDGERYESSGLVPDDCWGSYPSSVYQLDYDGGGWTDVGHSFVGLIMSLLFFVGRGAIQIALWVIGWAYSFDMNPYNVFALGLAQDYQINLTENVAFGFVDMVWFALFAWAAFTALKGRISMAGGEIVASVVLATLITFFMSNMGAYLHDTWDFMDSAATDILVAGQGEDPATSDDELPEVVRDTQSDIHKVFVEEPYDYLNWSGPLRGDCAAARDEILGRDLHSDDADEAYEVMQDAGCEKEAEFFWEPDGARMLGAALYMVTAAIVAIGLGGLGATVVVGKFLLLGLFAVTPFAALAFVAPAGGRRGGWLWVTTAVQAGAVVIEMTFVLSVGLRGMRYLLTATADVGLQERFAVFLLAALIFVAVRRRIVAGGQAAAGRFADNLTNARLGGGGAPWQGPSGSSGANLLNVDRGLRYTAYGAGFATRGLALTAGRSVARRSAERRAARSAVRGRRRADRRSSNQTRGAWGGLSSSTGGQSGNPEPGFGPGTRPRPGGPGPTGPGDRRPAGGGPGPTGGGGMPPRRPPVPPPGGMPPSAGGGRGGDGSFSGDLFEPAGGGGMPPPAGGGRGGTGGPGGGRPTGSGGPWRASGDLFESGGAGAFRGDLHKPAGGGSGRGGDDLHASGDPRLWVTWTEYHSGSMHPVEMAKDKLANHFNQRRAERVARRRGFDVPIRDGFSSRMKDDISNEFSEHRRRFNDFRDRFRRRGGP